MSPSLEEIKAIFKKELEREFKNVKIEQIEVSEGEDADGDGILNVVVVFLSDDSFDTRAAAGVLRRVRPSLEKAHEMRFPIISFVNSADRRALG